MLVTRWSKPLVIHDEGLRISVGSAEEAINWLTHEPHQDTEKWRKALRKCWAAIKGNLPPDAARSAVRLAAESAHG